jgi:hypothetical protein
VQSWWSFGKRLGSTVAPLDSCSVEDLEAKGEADPSGGMLQESMQHTEQNLANASLDSASPIDCSNDGISNSQLRTDGSLLPKSCSCISQLAQSPADDDVSSFDWDCPVPLVLQQAIADISLQVYLESTGHEGGNLNQQALNINKALHQSSSSSVLFTR